MNFDNVPVDIIEELTRLRAENEALRNKGKSVPSLVEDERTLTKDHFGQPATTVPTLGVTGVKKGPPPHYTASEWQTILSFVPQIRDWVEAQ